MTLRTVAHHAPLSTGDSPGSNPRLLHLLHWQVDSSPLMPPGKPSCQKARVSPPSSKKAHVWLFQSECQEGQSLCRSSVWGCLHFCTIALEARSPSLSGFVLRIVGCFTTSQATTRFMSIGTPTKPPELWQSLSIQTLPDVPWGQGHPWLRSTVYGTDLLLSWNGHQSVGDKAPHWTGPGGYGHPYSRSCSHRSHPWDRMCLCS